MQGAEQNGTRCAQVNTSAHIHRQRPRAAENRHKTSTRSDNRPLVSRDPQKTALSTFLSDIQMNVPRGTVQKLLRNRSMLRVGTFLLQLFRIRMRLEVGSLLSLHRGRGVAHV